MVSQERRPHQGPILGPPEGPYPTPPVPALESVVQQVRWQDIARVLVLTVRSPLTVWRRGAGALQVLAGTFARAAIHAGTAMIEGGRVAPAGCSLPLAAADLLRPR